VRIIMLGAGYVGLVSGVCFAELGHDVTCVDVVEEKILALQAGKVPIYEPGLSALLTRNIKKGRLQFSTTLSSVAPAEVYFIAVGTPGEESGMADLRYVYAAAKDIAGHLVDGSVVVDKSTVPVGTADQVRQIILEELASAKKTVAFDVVSNPEFLKEGAAVADFLNPDRVVLGVDSKNARDKMTAVYAPLTLPAEKLIFMDIKAAEMTKYAANAFLATKISFINEIANLCTAYDVDVEQVKTGITLDKRIGRHFLNPGCGYGGSCFPKDVRALTHMASVKGVEPMLLRAVDERNARQKQLPFRWLKTYFQGKLRGLTVALWGLAFKPNTDDLRQASAVTFLTQAMRAGLKVKAYDPIAMDAARQVFPSDWFHPDQLTLVDNPYEATAQADVLIIMTEWPIFYKADLARLAVDMSGKLILDGRNVLDKDKVVGFGFDYQGVGR
jgi:UDPglucose 6-dehydrogenase